MDARQKHLYEELCAMQLTPPGVTLSFESRLARENGWDLAQAIAVVNEYRKFLLLMLEAGHPVTPSDQVDQAWHLHLVYTDSYWNDLCGRIAGRALHHGPTAGGSNEKAKFSDWYERTKTSYRVFFGHEPAEEIWPDQETRFGVDICFQRVNIARNLVIPRPGHLIGRCVAICRRGIARRMSSPKTTSNSATAPAIAPLWLGMMNPFDFNGRDFLTFYSITIVVAVIVAIILRTVLRNRDTLETVSLEKMAKQLGVDEIAFLKHGPKGPVNAAIAALSHEGKLTADIDSQRLTTSVGFSSKLPLLQQTILSAAGSGDGKTILDIRKACGSVVVNIARSLKNYGLVESFSSYLLPRSSSVLVMLAVLALGLGRIYVGLERDKPVGFLIALSILVMVITWMMMRKPRLTTKGKQVLVHLQQDFKKSGLLPAPERSNEPVRSAHDIGMSVALFGVAAMSTQMLDANIEDLLIHDQSRAWGDGGSYSGGCGGGGGGCGGGGGGGGCGG